MGNPWRHDDGLGPAVICALGSAALPDGVRTLEHHGEGLSLLDAWQGFARVIIVDAIRANAEPGSLYCFDAARENLPTGLFHYSSHQFGLAEAIALGRNLGKLPPSMTVYGVVGEDFSYGEGLSVSVLETKVDLCRWLKACLVGSNPLSDITNNWKQDDVMQVSMALRDDP